MGLVKQPRWLDAAEKYFREHFEGGSGSPKWIARTCCEVSAWYNDRQIKGETVVDIQAVRDGLDAYDLVHNGKQPYLPIGVRIQTYYPYRAILFSD